ncbi:MAG: ATP-binding protein, partial [Hyphomicrobiaceae bacterium]
MRLKRGTGIDGLAGMRPARKLPNGATHLRPLLDVAKLDVIQFMHNANKTWREDPSNQNQIFERVRVRDLQSEFDSLGITRENLARTARRADQFVRYLDSAIENKIADAAGAITAHDLGFFTVTHAWFERLAPLEQVRLLSEMIASVGGQAEPVPLGQLEDIVESLSGSNGTLKFSTASESRQGFTLHGAQVDIGRTKFRVYRETLDARTLLSALPNRLAAQSLTPGQVVVWDHRFVITLSDAAPHPVTVGPLTERGLADLEAHGWQRPDVPARVLWTLPVFRHNGTISAFAHNDLNTSPLAPSHCVVTRHRIPYRPGAFNPIST